MKLNKVFSVVEINIDGANIQFSKSNDKGMDDVSVVVGSEPSPLDVFTREEIINAEEIAKDEFKRRGL